MSPLPLDNCCADRYCIHGVCVCVSPMPLYGGVLGVRLCLPANCLSVFGLVVPVAWQPEAHITLCVCAGDTFGNCHTSTIFMERSYVLYYSRLKSIRIYLVLRFCTVSWSYSSISSVVLFLIKPLV